MAGKRGSSEYTPVRSAENRSNSVMKHSAEVLSESSERKRKRLCALIGICTACLLMGAGFRQRMQELAAETGRIQEDLAQEVLRFHVLANSDSREDQQVKLKVRDAVLACMKEDMRGADTGDGARRWARAHLGELEKEAEQVLEQEGYSYGAQAEVTTCYFPEKRYGELTFPAGNYEALRIELGSGKGQNWWCVLYPNLCFIDSACTVVSEEGKDELQHVLEDEEYDMITSTTNFKIKWFFFGRERENR